MKKDGVLENEKAILAARNTSLPAFVMDSLRNHRQRQNAKPAEKAHDFPVIASYNVHKCVGRDRKFDPDRTSRVIQEIGADIIALQEADSRFGERTGLLDLAQAGKGKRPRPRARAGRGEGARVAWQCRPVQGGRGQGGSYPEAAWA